MSDARHRRPLTLSPPATIVLLTLLLAAGCGTSDEPEEAPPSLFGDELELEWGPGTPASDDPAVQRVRDLNAPLDIVLITLDTLRADRVGCYGHPSARTPTLDRIAADGVRVERALATCPVTLPSHTSIMTGLVPAEHGALDNGAFHVHDSITTTAEALKEAGYSTAAFVSSHVLSSRYGLDQGFDHYDDRMTPGSQGGLAHERRAGPTLDAALTWMESSPPRPWFLWIHLYDPHFPYDPPAEFRAGLTPYDGEVAYMDRELGRFLQTYDTEGRRNSTFLVVAGDHGEGLSEHREQTHGLFLYDTTMRVPLLLRHPRVDGGKTLAGQVLLTDLHPTMLDAASLDLPPSACSVSLLRVLTTARPQLWQDAFLETSLPHFTYGAAAIDALCTKHVKYIRAPRAELYDWRSDPQELTNQLTAQRERADELHGRIERLRTDFAMRRPDAQRTVSDEERASLIALGYLTEDGEGDAFSGMDPKDAVALVELRAQANACVERQQLDRAEYLYRQVLAKAPRDASALGGLGVVHTQQGQIEQAVQAYRRCLEVRPDFYAAAFELARLYRSRNRFAAARDACDHVLRYNPAEVGAYLLASEVSFLQNDAKAARQYLDDALTRGDPTSDQRLIIEQRRSQLPAPADGGP